MTLRYGHFCLAARTLETVGDRWSLLIVRDLLTGPRRFSDLRRLLTNVTAKWLTIRLRQLERDGIVNRDEQAGRREVRYELTDKGRDLAPVLEALLAWGLKYELHPLEPDEAAHPEHLVAGLAVALNEAAPKPSRPRAWRFQFGDGDRSFALVFDGERWSPADAAPSADVVVRTTPRAWAAFVRRPPARRRLPTREIRLSGAPDQVAELAETLGAVPAKDRAPQLQLRPQTEEAAHMSALDIVNDYYRACNHGGDLSEVPLADDLTFRGPLGSVEGAANFRAQTAARGQMKCSIREQFVNGNRVCSIVDWELPGPVPSLTTTEILEVRNGQIVSGEVIFGPERIRAATETSQAHA